MSDLKICRFLNLVTGSSSCAQLLQFTQNLGSQLSLFVEYRQFYEFHSMCWFSFVNGSSLLLLYQKHCSSNSKCLKYHQIGAKTQAKVMNNTRMDPGSVALGNYDLSGSAVTHFSDNSLLLMATDSV